MNQVKTKTEGEAILRVDPATALRSWLPIERYKGYLVGRAIEVLATCEGKDIVDNLEEAAALIGKAIEISAEQED